jgi:hypothetical protein
VSKLFTLDACRHGRMTELEEAELTDGQGRALSGHKTASSSSKSLAHCVQTRGGFALYLPKRNRHGISKCGVN